jgi:DNA repair protein RecO (recombination protein O)
VTRAHRLATERLRSDALLLRRTAFGESDDIVHFFTESAGAVAAVARGARRSQRRFHALEPMHVLHVTLEVAPGRELARLTEAVLVHPRLGVTSRLGPMMTAGRALGWLRRAAPAHTPEPALWREMNALLDRLDGALEGDGKAALAASGLRILGALGWGLELHACVRCGRPCPDNARARVDVAAGGVVCSACGGVGRRFSAAARRALVAALEQAEIEGDPEGALELCERALEVHARGDAH